MADDESEVQAVAHTDQHLLWYFLDRATFAAVSQTNTLIPRNASMYRRLRCWGTGFWLTSALLNKMQDTFDSRLTMISVYAQAVSKGADPVEKATVCADGIMYFVGGPGVRLLHVPHRIARELSKEFHGFIERCEACNPPKTAAVGYWHKDICESTHSVQRPTANCTKRYFLISVTNARLPTKEDQLTFEHKHCKGKRIRDQSVRDAFNSFADAEFTKRRCASCGADGACQKCENCWTTVGVRVLYCSRQCQKQHWKTHKANCGQWSGV